MGRWIRERAIETQLNSQLAKKANTTHTHTKNQINDFFHNHDDRYFTESEVNIKFASYTLKLIPNLGAHAGFNSYISQGQYLMADDAGITQGNPHDGTCWGALFVHVSTGDTYNGQNNWIWQEFWSTNGNLYRRMRINNGGWTSWKIY